jgi:hypothetical protein
MMKNLRNGWLVLVLVLAGADHLEAQPTFHESLLYLRTEAKIDPLGYQWRVSYTWLTGGYLDDSQDCAVSASSSRRPGPILSPREMITFSR